MTVKRTYEEVPSSAECLADTLKSATPKLGSCVHIEFKGNQVVEIAKNPDMIIDYMEEKEDEMKKMREDLRKLSLKEKMKWFTERYISLPIYSTYDSEIVLSICRDLLKSLSVKEDTKTAFIQLLRSKFTYIWIAAICELPSLSKGAFSELIAALNVIDKVKAQTLQLVGKDNLNEGPKNYFSAVTLKRPIRFNESMWSSEVCIEAKLSYINLVLDSNADQISAQVAQNCKKFLEEYLLITKGIKSIIPLTDPNHSVSFKRAPSTTHQYFIENCSDL